MWLRGHLCLLPAWGLWLLGSLLPKLPCYPVCSHSSLEAFLTWADELPARIRQLLDVLFSPSVSASHSHLSPWGPQIVQLLYHLVSKVITSSLHKNLYLSSVWIIVFLKSLWAVKAGTLFYSSYKFCVGLKFCANWREAWKQFNWYLWIRAILLFFGDYYNICNSLPS